MLFSFCELRRDSSAELNDRTEEHDDISIDRNKMIHLFLLGLQGQFLYVKRYYKIKSKKKTRSLEDIRVQPLKFESPIDCYF